MHTYIYRDKCHLFRLCLEALLQQAPSSKLGLALIYIVRAESLVTQRSEVTTNRSLNCLSALSAIHTNE